MDLMKIAADLLVKQLKQEPATSVDPAPSTALDALKGLLPTDGGELNLAELAGQFMGSGGGVAAIAASWLGGGENKGIDAGQIIQVLGNDKLSAFAEKLGIDPMVAASALSAILPKLIDQGSTDGKVDAGAIAGMAKGMLGGLFK